MGGGGADCCRSCTEEFLQFKNIYLYKYTHSTIEGDLFNFWQYFKITFYFCLFLSKKAGKCCNWEARRHAYFRGSKHSLRPYLELWQEKGSFWLHTALSNKNTSALYLLENMLISGKWRRGRDNKAAVLSYDTLEEKDLRALLLPFLGLPLPDRVVRRGSGRWTLQMDESKMS